MAGVQPDQPADAPVPAVVAASRGTGGRRWDQLRRIPALTFSAIRLVRAAAPRQFLATTLLQVVAAALVGVQLVVAKLLVTDLVEISRGADADPGTLGPTFAALIVAFTAAGIIAALLAHQQRLLADIVAHHTMDGLIDVASSVDLASYEDPDFYDHLERARNAAMFRPLEMVMSVTTLMTALLTSAGVAIALAALEPILLPLVLLAGVPVLLAALHNSRQTYVFEFGMTTHAREHLHLMDLLTGRESAKELRVFDATAFLRHRYDALTRERITRLREFLRGRLVVSLLGTTATAIGTALALGSLVWLLATDRTDVATAVTAAIAMQILATRLQAVTGSISKIVEAGLFLDDYAGFLELQAATDPSAAPTRDPAEPFRGLRVEGLSFTYPKTSQRVLDEVSLEINPGEVVALVGENGSGKTTLVKLLCRLYRDADAGRILWNGRDVRDVDPRDVRDQMTVLFQDFVQYELSVADNIALGRAEGRASDLRDVEAAARQAGAHDLVGRLPHGYETRLGRQFLGGHELSGGQWQRLALARAFYRGGEFLILDEPTSALDPRAEHELFEQMRTLAAGKAVLLISHRFSSVRTADRIYVLQEGRVVEEGTHEALVERGGLYAELYALQAAAYFGEHRTP